MSGRRIDDHANWTGSAEKGGVFARDAKMKQEHSAEGAGHLGSTYPDTTDQIRSGQMKADAKTKAHKMKESYRY